MLKFVFWRYMQFEILMKCVFSSPFQSHLKSEGIRRNLTKNPPASLLSYVIVEEALFSESSFFHENYALSDFHENSHQRSLITAYNVLHSDSISNIINSSLTLPLSSHFDAFFKLRDEFWFLLLYFRFI